MKLFFNLCLLSSSCSDQIMLFHADTVACFTAVKVLWCLLTWGVLHVTIVRCLQVPHSTTLSRNGGSKFEMEWSDFKCKRMLLPRLMVFPWKQIVPILYISFVWKNLGSSSLASLVFTLSPTMSHKFKLWLWFSLGLSCLDLAQLSDPPIDIRPAGDGK